MILHAGLVVGAYLLGSVSVAWLVARAHGVDLRQHGSGNLGATNAGRVLGGRWFAVVFLADCAKGAGPVLAARFLLEPLGSQLDPWWPAFAGIAAVLGHVFPLWHGFKGGKAVATALGVLIALAPLSAACAAAVWLLTWLIAWKAGLGKSGAVGPASMLAAPAAAAAHLILHWPAFSGPALPATVIVLVMVSLILVRHRSNFMALMGRRTAA